MHAFLSFPTLFRRRTVVETFCARKHIDSCNHRSRTDVTRTTIFSRASVANLRSSTKRGTEDSWRVNKVFSNILSRREADKMIEQGRVTRDDGEVVRHGARVCRGEGLLLDGNVVDWEENLAVKHQYLKYWKPKDLICTTDIRIENSILNHLKFPFEERVFNVGRLDEASTGLLILTSDGLIPQIALGAGRGKKIYMVEADQRVSDRHLEQMQEGVVIKTVAQRDRGVRKPLVAKTNPCTITRGSSAGSRWLKYEISEGRNRQIRKMLGVLGYTARKIHRTGFLGVTLQGLEREGDWTYLSQEEIALISQPNRETNSPTVESSFR